jgi:hypothetical protein
MEALAILADSASLMKAASSDSVTFAKSKDALAA